MTSGIAAGPVERSRQRDDRHLWHPWSAQSAASGRPMLVRGAGYRVWDADGDCYVDAIASSLNATCGYGHPDLIEAITAQLARLHHFDMSVGSHEPAGALAERLAGLLPAELSRTLLVNSGSEAVEAAIAISAAHWARLGEQRSGVITFARGYHGTTHLSRSLSGLPAVATDLRPPLPITKVELPCTPAALREPDALHALLNAFENALDTRTPPVAVLVEPLLNVGGGVVLPGGFLKALRGLCDDAGTLLVLDEVFTGFGRTGRMFAFEHEHVVPDVLVTSKGLNSGYVPLAAVTTSTGIDRSCATGPDGGFLPYGHTTSGHAVACAAALATLRVLERDRLVDNADVLGRRLLDGLAPLVDHPSVVDVRGTGLVAVLEMSGAEQAIALVDRARRGGLLLRRQGPVVMALPPLVIDAEGIESIVRGVERALREEDR